MAESLFTSQTPATPDGFDGGDGLTLCTLVQFAVDGNVTGIRWFFPTSGLVSSPIGALYSRTNEGAGVLLDSKTFTSLTLGTWNSVLFDTPVAVTAGQLYYAAVWCKGGFTATSGLFVGAPIVNGNITGPQDQDPGQRNGRLAIGGTPAYPTIGNGNGFLADVLFEASGADVDGDASVSAVATVIPVASITAPGSADLTGTATVSADAALELPAAATLTATATITATATVTTPGQDDLLLPKAVELLACLREALEARPNPPGIICLRAGDSVIQDMGIPGFSQDECCVGQAYVRIAGFYMTGTADAPFPSPSTDSAVPPCGAPAWGLQLEMGVFRCVRTNSALTCPEWTTAAMRQMNDAKAMRAALCCFEDLQDPGTVSLGNWNPSGPDGGCLGSTWTITVEVLNECEDC